MIPTSLREILQYYVIPYGGMLVVALLIYTLISTIVATTRYNKGRKITKQYEQLLKALDKEENEKA